ncbi:hypothetical protein JW906_04500 [bacterium]|nr:hypothetical protein [bacterium]
MRDRKDKGRTIIEKPLPAGGSEKAEPDFRGDAGKALIADRQPRDMKLSARIERICRSDASERDLRDFIGLCVRLACGALRILESRGYRIFEQRGMDAGESERIALDALADLFERNPSGEFIHLRRYFEPRLQKDLSDEECLMLLRRLVFNRTRQGIFHLFRDRDPQGARVYRCVKLAVFKDGRYETAEHLGREWISDKTRKKTRISGRIRIMDWEGLKAELFARFRPEDDAPQMLKKIFRLAESVSNGPVQVAMDDAARLIREYRQVLARPETAPSAVSDSEDDLFADETARMLDLIQDELCLKIEASYVRKGRMDPDCAQRLKNALAAMVRDLKDGSPLYPFFDYLKDHMPAAAAGGRRTLLRSRFEYMVKLFKARIAEDFFSGETLNAAIGKMKGGSKN